MLAVKPYLAAGVKPGNANYKKFLVVIENQNTFYGRSFINQFLLIKSWDFIWIDIVINYLCYCLFW